MAAATTSDEFLDLLRKSELLSADRLNEASQSIPAEARDQPKRVAEHLVKSGFLTPFQAGLILNGKWRGFQIANGKYKLLQLLGVGGMGKVYLCEHVRMKRLVALKVLPFDQLKDPGAIERFNREAVAAANLNHPNIVKAYDIDQDGSLHFLVLEYVDGASLHEIVKKHGPLDIPRACHYIAQAAQGLQHAHESGWVHRDVKPGNLLLDRAGTIKILDMGLARYFAPGAASLTQQIGGTVLGTADFLSPEQAVDSSDVDIRSDIYSLGATLYFLIVGKAPFEAGTVTEKLLAHQLKEPESVSSLRPDTPKALEIVLKKMMAKRPVHRYQTPAAVIDALAPWTSVLIEPPAPEEMPRLSAALEAYQSGVPSGPISGVGLAVGGRASTVRNGPRTASHNSHARVAAAPWLPDEPRRRFALMGAGAGGLLLLGLLLGWKFLGGEKEPAPGPVAQIKTAEAPPARVPTPPPSPAPATPQRKPGVLSPAEAGNHINERVTVEFHVKNTGETKDRSKAFLNSGDRNDPDNFTVVIEVRKLGDALTQAGMADPKEYFRRKTVRVSGLVQLYNKVPQIVVDDVQQIEVVAR